MKISKIILGLFLLGALCRGQVGIGTVNPRTSLDVNGSVMLRNELKVGGSKSTVGNGGNTNQILVSYGEGKTPQWKDSKVGFFEVGEYKTTSSYIKSSETGLIFESGSNDNINTSSLGEPLDNTKWKELNASFKTDFTLDNSTNKINILFQTGIESTSVGNSENQNIKFVCGIFIDNKLVALRADQIDGIRGKGSNNQSIYTLNYTVNDLTAGSHYLQIGCRRINSTTPTHTLGIGRSIDNTVANNFMLQSILKFDVSELVILTR